MRITVWRSIGEWSDELARSGELFPVLFTNPISGMSTVRTVPACRIESVEVDPEDYETELRYRETTPVGMAEKWWFAPHHADAEATAGADPAPVMLHFAVNRPIGAVRGESDLAPILPWLRRYNAGWRIRVRLNAAVRSFCGSCMHRSAARRTAGALPHATDPGSVIIAEQDAETWQAVTPTLHAADASRMYAIRWMIVAGGRERRCWTSARKTATWRLAR